MTLNGTVEEIIFRNEENGYTVLLLNVKGDMITAVGKFPLVNAGENLELQGSYISHAKYGEQFAVTTARITAPTTEEGIIRYLSSGLIKGVGPVTATNIVEYFKDLTLDIIEFNPSRLAEVKGISAKKALAIGEAFFEIKKMQNAILFLQNYNISTNMAVKIYNAYKDKTELTLKSNPYKLVEDIDGVGFLTADKIAQNMGIEPDSEFRMRAGILHILKENSDKSGNTFIYYSNLIDEIINLLRISGENIAERVDYVLNKLIIDAYVKVFDKEEEQVVMLSKFYNIEKHVATTLKLLDYDISTNYNIENDIAEFERINNLTMHAHQKDAVAVAVNNGVSIITGGPGTGKTTIIKCILEVFKNLNKKVQLMAPTGRAAKRLSESTGQEALTIHRALEVSFSDMNMFNYNHMNKLPYDVIIVDEVSMVDVQLMYYLARAIRRGANLVLVGDKDQLASVGAGNVLDDILKSNIIESVCLTEIYRQDKNSLIIANAHRVNGGKMPVFDNKSNDFFFYETSDNEMALKNIIEMATFRIPNFLKCDAHQIQVLAPMKAGVCGIDNINKQLQHSLNPPALKKAEVVLGEKAMFREGDRVMQTSNNYERVWLKNGKEGTGVFNGDIGLVDSINAQTGEVNVMFEDGRLCNYLKGDLNEIVLSYAITIHKSQGSEFDAVIIPLAGGPPMLLTRNLLYTAITRAKKMVVLVGSKAIINRMVRNNYTKVRYTMLEEFLKENLTLIGEE